MSLLGRGGLSGVKSLLAGHPFSEQVGDAIGSALAQFLFGTGSSLFEQGTSRFVIRVGYRRPSGSRRRCGYRLAHPSFAGVVSRRGLVIRRSAKPETSSKGASHSLGE